MSKPRWIWTRDRRPKPGRTVLGWYGKGMGHIAVELSDDGRYYDDTGGKWGVPTLWIKLKKLPKSARGES